MEAVDNIEQLLTRPHLRTILTRDRDLRRFSWIEVRDPFA